MIRVIEGFPDGVFGLEAEGVMIQSDELAVTAPSRTPSRPPESREEKVRAARPIGR